MAGSKSGGRIRQPSTWTPVADIELEEFDPLPLQGVDLGLERFVGGHRADGPAVGQPDELGHGRRVEPAESVKGPAGRRRDVVPVDARLTGRADALGSALAVYTDAEEEALRGVRRRGGDVEPAAALVDGVDAEDVVVPRRQQLDLTAVAGHAIGVLPAVPLAQPEQAPAAVEPDEILHDLHPGLVRVGEDAPGLARSPRRRGTRSACSAAG